MMGWLTLKALDAVIPGNEKVPGIAASTRGPVVVAELRRDAPFEMRMVLNLAVLIWLVSPLFTVFVPLPAVWLPARLRHAHTDRLTSTSFYLVRQISLVLKQVAGMAWGQDPEVRAAYGMKPYPEDPGTWRGMS
ncbi:MAG: hypothetical protein VYB65_04065 [Myxococcota bacterium]|nr:hypothetical protein [Myxococcota bacterium]